MVKIEDVAICYCGNCCGHIYNADCVQWNGTDSNKDERAKAAEFMLAIKVSS